ncbi:MAG: ATP-binding protein [Desulfobacterales bacterium]|nr:ATP-binding protein [Pseudomonadota bacterium]MCG2771315.1 ATP-binding protein [Desulfobacterales bacterium]
MGAIPTSDLPGHKLLRERVINALDRCQESQGIEFKESGPWESLKWKIICTALAMANLRDGGIIVIGASEREQTWELTGIEPAHLETYNVDVIVGAINKYASPNVDLDIVVIKHSNGADFLAIQIREFNDTPIVCKKNGPTGKNVIEGAVYVRPPGIAKTTRVTKAEQMHDLLELAAEKRARRILEVSGRIGLEPRQTAKEHFDEELEGL